MSDLSRVSDDDLAKELSRRGALPRCRCGKCAEAERIRRDFDRKCAAAGLNNPPTWIRRETR